MKHELKLMARYSAPEINISRRGLLPLALSFFVLALLPVKTSLAEQVTTIPDKSRLISIGGAVTEIIYALGKGDEIIGRDSTSTYPDDVKAIDDVGYMRQLSPEGVLSLNPSAILMVEGSGPVDAVNVITKSSIPVVVVPDEHSAEGVIKKIEIMGKAINVDAQAKSLIAKVKREFAELEGTISAASAKPRILFILSLQNGRITASGRDTAADGIIQLAGGVNAVDSFSGYKQLTDEAIEKLEPDFILLMQGDTDHSARRQELLQIPAIALTPAGQSENIIMMDGLYLLSFGPRTAQAARELSQKIYGRNK